MLEAKDIPQAYRRHPGETMREYSHRMCMLAEECTDRLRKKHPDWPYEDWRWNYYRMTPEDQAEVKRSNRFIAYIRAERRKEDIERWEREYQPDQPDTL